MTTLLYLGTHGADDPTRATLPFHLAAGAVEGGLTVQIVLSNDAVLLMKDPVARAVQGVATPPLHELLTRVTAAGAEIFI
jgi:predicted peroxiredoxin